MAASPPNLGGRMPDHDVFRFAADLSAKLATRSRHVGAFVGAGAARACGLPDVAGLQTEVLRRLGHDNERTLRALLAHGNLEQVLSRLRRIAALLTGTETVDGLTGDAAADLDRAVCRHIVAALDVDGASLEPMRQFTGWAARANYHWPIELFTVNYDLLIETALEEIRALYFDGFVGALRARFQIDLVEQWPEETPALVSAAFVRLWKLHGSVNWAWTSGSEIVRLGHPVTTGQAAAIYPSDTKYEESRRVPFVVLQDRFRRALNQRDADDHQRLLVLRRPPQRAALRRRDATRALRADRLLLLRHPRRAGPPRRAHPEPASRRAARGDHRRCPRHLGHARRSSRRGLGG